jgi:hypothetical protein
MGRMFGVVGKDILHADYGENVVKDICMQSE